MEVPVFIGDELTACGFRLAGARVHVVDESNIDDVFAAAVSGTEPVFLAAGSASRLRPGLLDAARRRPRPLLLIVPDATGAEPPDVTQRVRVTLGIE